jgi:L-arabinose isomerase
VKVNPPIRFSEHPDDYMERWFAEAPTHHCALSIGHNALQLKKVADLLQLDVVTL